MPLPPASAALSSLDSEGWQPLKHGAPQSMWPSGTASAPAMPGRWQLAPQGFLSQSPFSAPVEGEAMAPGAMNLLSAGRTPLVVSVLRVNTEFSIPRGRLVTVTTTHRVQGRKPIPNTYNVVDIYDACQRESDGGMNPRGQDGYIGVLSAAVEEGQEEVAISVGGVDMIRFSELDCHTFAYPVGADVTIGDVYRPGFIPLTTPQRCPRTKDQIFSAYIEPSMLTHLKATEAVRPQRPWTDYDDAANVGANVEAQLRTLRAQLAAYPDYIANQEISNSLEGFNKDDNVGTPLWKPNTVGEVRLGRDQRDPQGPVDPDLMKKVLLYFALDDVPALLTLLNDLTDTDGVKPMTVDRWKAHLAAGTMYTVIELPANLPLFSNV